RCHHLSRAGLQLGAGFGMQLVNPHVLRALGALALAIISAPTLALAQPLPIGRRQSATVVAHSIHIRFYQHWPQTVAAPPIPTHLSQSQPVTLGGQIRQPDPAPATPCCVEPWVATAPDPVFPSGAGPHEPNLHTADHGCPATRQLDRTPRSTHDAPQPQAPVNDGSAVPGPAGPPSVR